MLKILLTSDIHLNLRSEILPRSEKYRIETFKRISFLAKKFDLLIIAGDLFDSTDINSDLIDLIRKEFSEIRACGVEIIYTPGENELNEDKTLPSFLYNLNLTHIFSDTSNISSYSYSKNGQKVYIYGLPAGSDFDISKIEKLSGDGFHLGLFHLNFYLQDDNRDSGVFRFEKWDKQSLNLDFYALGHYHDFKLYKLMGRVIGAYPGSPESTSLKETGDRYVLSIIIEDDEVSQVKRFAVNSIRYDEITLNCSELNDSSGILKILEEKKSLKTSLIINLIGERDFIIDHSEIEGFNKEFCYLYINDQSIPLLEILIEEFINEDSLRGEFFEVLNQRINKGELPEGIVKKTLTDILLKITRAGYYSPEEWLCRYKNV